MSFGLEVRNDAGRVQIDEEYRNLLLVAQGTAAAAYAGGFTFPAQSSCTPLVCVRPVTDGTYIGFMNVSSTSATYFSDGPFDWAVYGLDSPVYLDGSSYGLQVFSASGSLAFDSRCEPVRIKAVASGQSVWPDVKTASPMSSGYNNYPVVINFTAFGLRPWMCINQLTYFDEGDGGTIAATTSGLGQVTVRYGVMVSGTTWTWAANDGANGYLSYSLAFGSIRIPIVKR